MPRHAPTVMTTPRSACGCGCSRPTAWSRAARAGCCRSAMPRRGRPARDARAADAGGPARLRGHGRGARGLDRGVVQGTHGTRDGDDRVPAGAAQVACPFTRGAGRMKTDIPDLTGYGAKHFLWRVENRIAHLTLNR